MKIEIREIKDKDNDKIKQVLVSVMTEFGVQIMVLPYKMRN